MVASTNTVLTRIQILPLLQCSGSALLSAPAGSYGGVPQTWPKSPGVSHAARQPLPRVEVADRVPRRPVGLQAKTCRHLAAAPHAHGPPASGGSASPFSKCVGSSPVCRSEKDIVMAQYMHSHNAMSPSNPAASGKS
ncbi:hypothetical protein NDU88_006631 [Pleurodeles waltl]|uniref:Secreted protein n=1 Tax=Pleurodeles waltl TaxID=8319 RepID=A0AAV7MZR8_PLEWA|nr:hypothetical protein NDU88_006631 [Pleurodeles waltl]